MTSKVLMSKMVASKVVASKMVACEMVASKVEETLGGERAAATRRVGRARGGLRIAVWLAIAAGGGAASSPASARTPAPSSRRPAVARTTAAAPAPGATTVALQARAGFERIGGDLCSTLEPSLQLSGTYGATTLRAPLRWVVYGAAERHGLRRRDWDGPAEWLRPLRALVLHDRGGRLRLGLHADRALTLGDGTLVAGVRPGLLPDSYQLGLDAAAAVGPLETALVTDDVMAWRLIGARLGVRPGDRGASRGAWTSAIELATDRGARVRRPQGGLRGTEHVAALWHNAWDIAVADRRVHDKPSSIRLFAAAGVATLDGQRGYGWDAGLRWRRAGPAPLHLTIAAIGGRGVWLPGAFDAGHLAERDGRSGPALATRLQALGPDGVGVGARAAVDLSLAPGVALHGEARALPAGDLGSGADFSSWAMRGRWTGGAGDLQLGWMRRPLGVHLAAAGASWALSPALRASLQVERALHASGDAAALVPAWNVGLFLGLGT